MSHGLLVFHVSVDLLEFSTFVMLEKLTHTLLFWDEGQDFLICWSVHASFRAQVGHDTWIGETVASGSEEFAITLGVVLVLGEGRSIVRILVTVEAQSIAVGLLARFGAESLGVLGIT
jgi:hypothetical protein